MVHRGAQVADDGRGASGEGAELGHAGACLAERCRELVDRLAERGVAAGGRFGGGLGAGRQAAQIDGAVGEGLHDLSGGVDDACELVAAAAQDSHHGAAVDGDRLDGGEERVDLCSAAAEAGA